MGPLLENKKKLKGAILEKKISPPPRLLKTTPTGGSRAIHLLFIIHRCRLGLHHPPPPSASPSTVATNHDPFIIDDFLKDYDFSPSLTSTIPCPPAKLADASVEFTKIIISNLKKHSCSYL
jgi:hypothetical protein